MRAGRWDFNPSLLPTLATAILLPLLASLGFWQLNRADEKAALYREFIERSSGPPLDQDTIRSDLMDEDRVRYRRLRLQGRFDVAHHFLLDNQVHDGVAGYHVFTLFLPAGEKLRLLVNRGWVPGGRDRSLAPVFETPPGPVEISGLAKPPSGPGLVLADTPEEPLGRGMVRVQRIEPEQIARQYGWILPSYVLRLDAGSAAGFVRDWPPTGSGRERHLAYAFQWFALAVLLLVIYIVVNLKRRESTAAAPPERGPTRS